MCGYCTLLSETIAENDQVVQLRNRQIFIFRSHIENAGYPMRGIMCRHIGKPTICISENKGADQLRRNCEADQRLCFRYTDSTISLLVKSEISSFLPASLTVQVGLCQTWSETRRPVFSRPGSYVTGDAKSCYRRLRQTCHCSRSQNLNS